jgi:SHS2 domain-containing protein
MNAEVGQGVVLIPSHAFLEHTGEVHLRVHAGSLSELLAEAGRALAQLQLRGGRGDGVGPWTEVEVRSTDRAALLVDWLNELIYQAESGLCLATEFDLEQIGESGVRGRVRGIPVAEPPALVKAATLHGARLEAVKGGFEGDVILDV